MFCCQGGFSTTKKESLFNFEVNTDASLEASSFKFIILCVMRYI